MARSINDSLSLLETTLGDITTSLANKEVIASNLKASQVPDKIREIKLMEYGTTYGVKITESNSDPYDRVTYIDDAVGKQNVTVDPETGKADFHSWKYTWVPEKFYPVMLKTDGTIDYKLNPNDYSKREDGSPSDVANINYDGNAMVCVEKFFTKFSMDGENEVIEISDQKKNGFEAIGFIRSDGSEADRIFLPMFLGSLDSSDSLRSISGQTFGHTSFNKYRTAAQKNGSTYDIETWAMNQAIQAVYLILMKNCDAKVALGAGREWYDSDRQMGKTGCANTLGAISCDPTTKSVKFMHIEDFTSYENPNSGIFRFEVGLLYKNYILYIKMRPPYSGDSASGYTQVSDYYDYGGPIKKMKCSNSFGRYPIEYGGSSDIYEAAYWYRAYVTESSVMHVSLRDNGSVAGRYTRAKNNEVTSTNFAALTYLPPA